MTFIERIVGDLGDKRQCRQHKTRVNAIERAEAEAEADDGEARS